jgi:hypothetical protein
MWFFNARINHCNALAFVFEGMALHGPGYEVGPSSG